MSESAKPEKSDLSEWLHEVVSAEAESEAEPLIIETERAPICFPHRFVLDGKARKVTCSRCSIEFLPYDALDYIARQWKEYATNLSIMKTDQKRLQESALRLRKEVQRLKAMEKRLLSDAMLVSGHIADWLEGVVVKTARPEYRPVVDAVAHKIRSGDWRGEGGKDKP